MSADLEDLVSEFAKRHYLSHRDRLTAFAERLLAGEEAFEDALPEEPREFGSIVLGRTVGTERILWQRAYNGSWYSEGGAVSDAWSYFQPDVEVLRLGAGRGPDEAALRVLLAHFNHRLEEAYGGAHDAYWEARARLAAILDGEA